jgi:hypothetical protein
LVLDFNEWGFGGMESLLPTTLDTLSSEVFLSSSPSDECSSMSYLLTFKQHYVLDCDRGQKRRKSWIQKQVVARTG